MWQALAAKAGSSMMSGLGGGAPEGPSSAQTSTSVSLNSGPFGGKDWSDYLPLILLALVAVVYIKKGGR